MSRHLPDRRTRTPELFAFLFDVLRAHQPDAYELWRALDRAHWSEAQALKGLFAFNKPQDLHTEADGFRFLHSQLAPARIVLTIEALVQERQLPRATATRVEECVFRRMTASGAWTT